MPLQIHAQKKKSILANKIKTVTVYNYDYEKNNGRQVKQEFSKYDEFGNIIEEIEYDDNGKETKHIKYEYDDEGNKIRETHLNPKGTTTKIIEYKYENGLKTERTVYQSNGKVTNKKKYSYEYY